MSTSEAPDSHPSKRARIPRWSAPIIWTVGALAVLVAFVLWWIVFAVIVVPSDERQLEARFGEAYLQYKDSVPRWFRLPRW